MSEFSTTGSASSAQLRQVRQSLADVERERDEALTNFQDTYEDLVAYRGQLKEVRRELAETQRALAASQADRSRADQLIRAITEERAVEIRELGQARQEIPYLRGELDRARVQIDAGRELIDQLIADRAGLRKELEQARAQVLSNRSWLVARNDDGLSCFDCTGPIGRGQAVEPIPGTTHGSWRHVHCPAKES